MNRNTYFFGHHFYMVSRFTKLTVYLHIFCLFSCLSPLILADYYNWKICVPLTESSCLDQAVLENPFLADKVIAIQGYFVPDLDYVSLFCNYGVSLCIQLEQTTSKCFHKTY